MTKYFQPVQMAKSFIKEHVQKNGIYIDATCGRGNDTLFLSEFIEEKGKVIALDIQKEAILSTQKLLEEHNRCKNVSMFLDTHLNIGKYAERETVDCIMFNLGWLPKGSHHITTKSETTIKAIEKSLSLIKPKGIISILIYHGKSLGYTEKDAVLEYLKTISNDFTVIKTEFLNRRNDPPINAFIAKD